MKMKKEHANKEHAQTINKTTTLKKHIKTNEF